MLTEREMERRRGAIFQLLQSANLKALLLIGDAGHGWDFNGDLRYYINNRTISQREAVVILPDAEPAYFSPTTGKVSELKARSFLQDCRPSAFPITDAIEYLKGRGIASGRIGVNFEMLPVAWYARLQEAFPKVEWAETHDQIMPLRLQRSREEVDILRRAAALADGSYEAGLKAIRPGMTEFEIIAEIEHYSRARGAEEHFTQIGSGKFSLREGTNLIFYYPTQRRIEKGDSLLMEITPRYAGYWTQVVRAVNVGKRNAELEMLQQVSRDVLNAGLEQLKPGRTMKDVVLAMEAYAKRRGYPVGSAFGHMTGIDMIEGRVSSQNEMELTPGTSIIIHPLVFTPDRRNWTFCGETYLVTEDGYERLNRTSEALITL
jgi:Xaa-Pro aminopeptidase